MEQQSFLKKHDWNIKLGLGVVAIIMAVVLLSKKQGYCGCTAGANPEQQQQQQPPRVKEGYCGACTLSQF